MPKISWECAFKIRLWETWECAFKTQSDTDISGPNLKVHVLLFKYLIYHFANLKVYPIKNRFFLVTFTLGVVSKFPTIIVVISHLKKVYLSIQKETPWYMKSMLNNLNLSQCASFTAFLPHLYSFKLWLPFLLEIKTKRGLPPSTYTTRQFTFEKPSSVLLKS